MPGTGPGLEGEIDEGVLEPHGLLAAVDDVFLDRLGEAVALLHELVEQADDALASAASRRAPTR